jgi:1-deoxy-D-xylulose-5-phosphate synthase
MRFVKPLDEAMLASLAARHSALVTLEENVVAGGAGSAVAEWLRTCGRERPILHLGIPADARTCGERAACLGAAGLDAHGLTASISGWLDLRATDRRLAAGA